MAISLYKLVVTSDDVASDAKIVVDWIHLQSSGSKIKNTIRAPTTALSTRAKNVRIR